MGLTVEELDERAELWSRLIGHELKRQQCVDLETSAAILGKQLDEDTSSTPDSILARRMVAENRTLLNEPKPRKITDEARAAETQLHRFKARILAETERHEERLACLQQEGLDYIDALPDDVRKMLVAGGVIEP